MNEILKQLNEPQQKAVQHINGPVMVIAGAGSGKTRVLTYRAAYLLTQGIDPFNILALTFTNKAAREMKERITKLIGGYEARNVWMGTFHSVFSKILRIEGHHLGYPQNYSIYDTDDTKRLIKAIIKEQNLNDKVYAPGYVMSRISGAKANLISVKDYLSHPEIIATDQTAGKPKLGEIYKIYQNRLKKSSAMDFDDLLFNTYILFRDYPNLLYKYQQKFKYIMVDEYQDTNHAQYMIVKSLAANTENICVVGDDAQSIYGFRGANIQNILNFKKDYPDTTVYKLEQNYRSTKTIVGAANGVIVNNKKQIFKEIWTDNTEGDKIRLLKANTDGEEGNMVANSIFELKMNHQLKNREFAILYRTNAQSRSMEEALRRLNIPYRIYGGLSFYNRKEIKDLLAYFRLVINNNDEEAFIRVINYPARGIGKTSIDRMVIEAERAGKTIWEIAENINNTAIKINTPTKNRIEEFTLMIKSFSSQVSKKNAFDLGSAVAKSSGLLKDLYKDKSPEGVSRYENIEELLNAIKEFTEKETDFPDENPEGENSVRTLDIFMQEVALLTDADKKNEKSDDFVSLMTIHMAKGLEFPYVFLVGLEENLFPSMQSLTSREDLEEERRLFYVAITRAMKKLTLSYAESRYKWGNLTFCEPSRFLEEIKEKYIDIPRKAPVKTAGFNMETPEQPSGSVKPPARKNLKKLNQTGHRAITSEAQDTIEKLQTGMEVEHTKFGKGKVIQIEGSGSNKKATIYFTGSGRKNLLLKFARLKIID